MDVRFQDGWLHVIWKWNKSICAWEYGGVDGESTSQWWGRVGVWYGWRVEGDRAGGVYCLLEVPEGCNCQVSVLQCTLVLVIRRIVVSKYSCMICEILFASVYAYIALLNILFHHTVFTRSPGRKYSCMCIVHLLCASLSCGYVIHIYFE